MASGDLATELNTGLHVIGDAAGAVGNDAAATGLHSAADSSVNSIDAYNQGDVVGSIGHGTTAIAQGTGNAGTPSTDGTSANAAASNVSGTETTTVVGEDGVAREAAVVTDPATGQAVATNNEVHTGVTLVA